MFFSSDHTEKKEIYDEKNIFFTYAGKSIIHLKEVNQFTFNGQDACIDSGAKNKVIVSTKPKHIAI